MTENTTPGLPGDPSPQPRRHRLGLYLLIAAAAFVVGIAAVAIVAAAGGTHAAKATASPPPSTSAPAAAVSDPDGNTCVPPLDSAGYCPGDDPVSTPSTEDLTGPLGTEYDVRTTDEAGNIVSYTVAADKVRDPARGADEFNTPDLGNRFVGVKFTITGTGGYASDNANNDAVIMGSDGQAYTADFSTLAAGTNFNGGDFGVTDNRTVTGWVAFQVPKGVSVDSVQWQPDSGFGGTQPATWTTGS